MSSHESHENYYVPAQSKWPIVASIGLLVSFYGVGTWFNDLSAEREGSNGPLIFFVGGLILAWMLFGWFGNVIKESRAGLYSAQMDRSFRWGMSWFIFSEVMFFAAFFGALFYARMFSVPWLGGAGDGAATHEFLWNTFDAAWPTNGPAELGGDFRTIPAWGIPLLNTLLLLASGVTLTIAHHALKAGERGKAVAPVARTAAPSTKGAPVMAPDGEESMMMAVTGGGAEGVLRNVGEMISREPLTPTELLVHALLLSNEFIYVN
jgi:cytochrome c oxidase subunit 3